MPDSAQLFLDDQEIGLTPLTLPDLSPGETHRIIVEKEGYIKIDLQIVVPKDTIGSYIFALEPEAELIITYYKISTGKAELFIDGVRKGVLEDLENIYIPVSQSKHDFEVKLDNRRIFGKTYQVEVGDKITINYDHPESDQRFRIERLMNK